MVYGNYGKDSLNGQFYTRNIVTGDKRDPGRVFPEQVQRHRNERLRHRQHRQELPRGAGEDRAHGGGPLQGDPLHPLHGGEQEALADRPALGHDQVHPGRHPPAPGPARAQDRGRRLRRQADQAGAAQRDPAPHHRLHLREGDDVPHGRHHRRPRSGDRTGVLLHGRPPGGAQARPAEGAGHEDDPLPGLLVRGGREGHRGRHGCPLHGGRLLGARVGRCPPVRESLPGEARHEDQGQPRHDRETRSSRKGTTSR